MIEALIRERSKRIVAESLAAYHRKNPAAIPLESYPLIREGFKRSFAAELSLSADDPKRRLIEYALSELQRRELLARTEQQVG